MVAAVQSLSCVWLFSTPWTQAHQASLFLTISQSLPKFMSIASVMLSSHLVLWCPLLLLPSVLPSIRDFSNESTEKTSESPLDSKEIKPVNLNGNQSWVVSGRTNAGAEAPVFWSSDANSWLTGKRPWLIMVEFYLKKTNSLKHQQKQVSGIIDTFLEVAPRLCPPDAKSQLIRKDPDAGKGRRQEEKGTTEDVTVGWHH